MKIKKKLIFVYFIFAILATLCACSNNSENELVQNPTLECEDIIVLIGEDYVINPTSNVPNAKYQYTLLDGDCVSLNNNVLTASKEGEALMMLSIEGYAIMIEVPVRAVQPGMFITGPKTVGIGETIELSLKYVGIDEQDDLVWRSSDVDIARVSKGIVTGIALGEIEISAKNDDYTATFKVKVMLASPKDLVLEGGKEEVTFEIGSNYSLEYEVTPKGAEREVAIESNNNCITIDEDGIITPRKEGTSILKVTSVRNEELVREIKINVVVAQGPIFKKTQEYSESLTVNFGDVQAALQGLTVIDNADGDVSSTVTTLDPDALYTFGTKEVTLVATDRAGHKTKFKRILKVEWQYHTKFIGHMGCYYAVPNTEEAFLYAAKDMHYQALECDLRSTKDGVLVICHDADFAGAVVAETNYEDLAKLEKSASLFALPKEYYGAQTYTGHICTFDRYLDICKEYNVSPVIELKGAKGMTSSDKSNIPTLMKLLRDKGLYSKAIILTSMTEVISHIRSLKETIKIQYLVDGGTDTVYNFCVTNNCDVSVNVTYGKSITDDLIKKFHDAGLEVSTYTFYSYSDYSEVQKWIDKGVDYVTCDWQYLTVGLLKLK